jgi:hypothetical protein
MAATPLSKNWTWKRLYGRVAVRLGQVKEFEMEPESLLQIGRMTIDEVFVNVVASFKKKFQRHGPFTVTADSDGQKIIDLAASMIFEISDVMFLSANGNRPYRPLPNSTALANCRVAWNPESAETGRAWFPELGMDTPLIRIHQGTGVSNESTLNVWYIRYPDTVITMADVEGGTVKVDFPDELMTYIAAKWIQTALFEKNMGVPENMADVMATINGLDAKLLQTDQAEKMAKVNTLTQ